MQIDETPVDYSLFLHTEKTAFTHVFSPNRHLPFFSLSIPTLFHCFCHLFSLTFPLSHSFLTPLLITLLLCSVFFSSARQLYNLISRTCNLFCQSWHSFLLPAPISCFVLIFPQCSITCEMWAFSGHIT